MFPILFKIPLFGLFGRDFFPIHSYGLMVALGFLFGSWFVQWQAKKQGEDPAKALDLVFYILVSSILGSRILFVITAEWDKFLQNPLHLFKIWEGGLVFYGGLIAAVLTSVWYVRKHHLPFWKFFDFFTPAVALGHAIGRQGCFLVGCCFGKPLFAKTWYSVTFSENIGSLAPTGIPLYPTQLMESFGEFLIFLGLAWALKRKKFGGQIFCLYLISYAVLRFFLEFLRGDFDRGFLFDGRLSTSQFIAAILFAFGIGLYLLRCCQSRRAV